MVRLISRITSRKERKMKTINYNHHEPMSGTGKKDEARKPETTPSIKVLQTWDIHREYLLRNKLRLF